jgi:Uma2 family endonuclease
MAMTTTAEKPSIRLVWEQAGTDLDLATIQGFWTEELYLKLTEHTNHLIEFTDGSIEALPMPTRRHQRIIAFLYELLVALVKPQGGEVLFAALRMQIRPGKYREPDVLLLLDARDPRNQDAYWLGADLVVEVVSPDDPERDTVTKRADYAEVGIPEYWIVNPLNETITVLALADDGQYAEHGVFARGTQATSRLIAGLAVSATELFDAQ